MVEPNNIEDFAEKMIQIVEYPLTNVRTNERLKYKAAVENYKDLLQILAHKKSKFSKIFDKIK